MADIRASIKKFWRSTFGKREEDERKLREEIRKNYPELDWKDEDEMIKIARETGIYDAERLREELIARKAERLRKNIEKEHEEYRGEIEERKKEEKIFVVRKPAKVPEDLATQEFEEDKEWIENMRLPEEEKKKLMTALTKEKEAKITGVPYGLPEGFPEEVKPIKKWRAKLFRPIHTIEPEDTRLVRAITWGKRRLDFIARKKNKDVVLKHKLMKMREYIKEHKLEKKKKEIDDLIKNKREIEKKIEERRAQLKVVGATADALLESYHKELDEISRRYENEEKEYNQLVAGLEAYMRDTATDLAVLKEILRGEVPRVVEEAKTMFHLHSPHIVERLRDSLLDFADAEAAKMIETNFKTIYQAAKGVGFFVKEVYRPISKPMASAYEAIGYTWRFIFEFIFSPITIGTVILWLLFSVFTRYMLTGPTLAVLIITIIIIVLMVFGEYWERSTRWEKNKRNEVRVKFGFDMF